MKFGMEMLGEFWRTKLTIVAIVLLMSIIGVGSHLYLKDDNAVEEIAEALIEKELSLPAGSIDLSPSDPEPRKPL